MLTWQLVTMQYLNYVFNAAALLLVTYQAVSLVAFDISNWRKRKNYVILPFTFDCFCG